METKGDMKYYSQYRIHDLFELQESLSGLSKSNRWVKLADRLPWAKIEKEYNKRLRNSHCGQATSPPAWLLGGLSSSLNRNEVFKGTSLSRFRKKQAWRPSKREFSVPSKQ